MFTQHTKSTNNLKRNTWSAPGILVFRNKLKFLSQITKRSQNQNYKLFLNIKLLLNQKHTTCCKSLRYFKKSKPLGKLWTINQIVWQNLSGWRCGVSLLVTRLGSLKSLICFSLRSIGDAVYKRYNHMSTWLIKQC